MVDLRIGNGFDVHRFATGRDLVLGGIKIDYPEGLAGHSDADVLVHSLIDALLGACGMGDIGKMFPDSDPRYKNISSIILLEEVARKLAQSKITIVNTDSTIVCQEPRISPYADSMKNAISNALGGLPVDRISIKGTTTEHLGFTGRGEGVAAFSVVLVNINP